VAATESPAVEPQTLDRHGLGRRGFLAVAGIGAVTAALSACDPAAPTTPVASSTTATTPPPTPSSSAPATPKPVASSTPTPTATATPTPSPAPVAAPMPNLVGTDPVWHLLRRTTFGATPALVAEVRAKGTAAWLAEQLNPSAIDDAACDAYLTRYPSLPMTTLQIRGAYPAFSMTPTWELVLATLARAIWSRRQLLEVMVEFWTNHFNVTTPGDGWDVKTVEDREVIRAHALGRFTDLLTADAKSPAMLQYLDNAASSAKTLNENYGRELLELHTVGVDAGYTQAEVVDSARLLTGYTIVPDGTFAYVPARHYVGPVKILGFAHPNGVAAEGLKTAEQYLAYLAHHPATAKRLATKLATRFVSDAPSDALVASLASVYLANDTAIAPVLTALFASAEFRGSIGQKTRRPLEDAVATLRAVAAEPAAGDNLSLSGLYWTLRELGQAPMYWAPPNGFPDVTAAWASTSGTLGRWNTHLGVLGNWLGSGFTTPAPSTLLGGASLADNGALVDLLALRLLGVRLGDPQRAALLTFLSSSGAAKVADAIRSRLDILAALVLDTPNWIQR
jgi:uncharacterized protein (DUF1800 family)